MRKLNVLVLGMCALLLPVPIAQAQTAPTMKPGASAVSRGATPAS